MTGNKVNLTPSEMVYADWKAGRYSTRFMAFVMEAISIGTPFQRAQMRKAFPELVDTVDHAEQDNEYREKIQSAAEVYHRGTGQFH